MNAVSGGAVQRSEDEGDRDQRSDPDHRDRIERNRATQPDAADERSVLARRRLSH